MSFSCHTFGATHLQLFAATVIQPVHHKMALYLSFPKVSALKWFFSDAVSCFSGCMFFIIPRSYLRGIQNIAHVSMPVKGWILWGKRSIVPMLNIHVESTQLIVGLRQFGLICHWLKNVCLTLKPLTCSSVFRSIPILVTLAPSTVHIENCSHIAITITVL